MCIRMCSLAFKAFQTKIYKKQNILFSLGTSFYSTTSLNFAHILVAVQNFELIQVMEDEFLMTVS